jgi:hypothetical protein
MTAKTSQHLADTLRAAGFEALAQRAEKDEFHDFLSEHALPETELDIELVNLMNLLPVDIDRRNRAAEIRRRHHAGEFDASTEESDEWAQSEDGRDTFRQLLGKEKRP